MLTTRLWASASGGCFYQTEMKMTRGESWRQGREVSSICELSRPACLLDNELDI